MLARLAFAALPAVALAQRTEAVVLESAHLPEATATVGVSAGTHARSSEYRSPRGLGAAGPAVFGSVSFDF